MPHNQNFSEGIHFDLANLPSKEIFDDAVNQLDLMATRQLVSLMYDELNTLVLTPEQVNELRKRVTAKDIQHDGDHYKKMKVEVWDIVDDLPYDQSVGYYKGNAIKYLKRMGTKDDELVEAKKAHHYTQKLVEFVTERRRMSDEHHLKF